MSTIEINDTIEISDLAKLMDEAFEVLDAPEDFDEFEIFDAEEDLKIVEEILGQFGFTISNPRDTFFYLKELGTPPKSTVFIEENYFEEHVLETLREMGIDEESNSSWFAETGELNIDFTKSHYRNIDIDGNSYYIGK